MTTTQELLEQSFEINLNNYGPEDVERLNDWAIKAYAVLTKLSQGVSVEPVQHITSDGVAVGYYSLEQLTTAIAAARVKALEDAASVSEDTVTALCGLPGEYRLIVLGDDIASNIRALKGGTA